MYSKLIQLRGCLPYYTGVTWLFQNILLVQLLIWLCQRLANDCI